MAVFPKMRLYVHLHVVPSPVPTWRNDVTDVGHVQVTFTGTETGATCSRSQETIHSVSNERSFYSETALQKQ